MTGARTLVLYHRVISLKFPERNSHRIPGVKRCDSNPGFWLGPTEKEPVIGADTGRLGSEATGAGVDAAEAGIGDTGAGVVDWGLSVFFSGAILCGCT